MLMDLKAVAGAIKQIRMYYTMQNLPLLTPTPAGHRAGVDFVKKEFACTASYLQCTTAPEGIPKAMEHVNSKS